MINLRSSALPRIMECPASKDAGEVPIDSTSDAATLGTAAHDVIQHMIREQLEDIPDLAPFIKKYGEQYAEDLRILAYCAANMWADFGSNLKIIDLEHELRIVANPIHLRGHADLVCAELNEDDETVFDAVVVVDWKTGWSESDHHHQLMSYLFMIAQGIKAAEYKYVVARVRTQEIETRVFTKSDLITWFKTLCDTVQRDTYNPGRHCHFCPKRFDCPARQSMLTDTAMVLSQQDKMPGLNANMLGLLYDRAQELKASLKLYDGLVAEALQSEGKLNIGNGRQLVYTKQQRETVPIYAAYKTLSQHFDYDEDSPKCLAVFADDLALSKAQLEKAARKCAPHRQKQKAANDLMVKLRSAGLVKVTEFPRKTERKELPYGS